MHFGDQRTGSVKNLKAALHSFFLYRAAHTMRAENQRRAGRYNMA
jgi:hypothetical protein